jgi:hypothetical protein
MLKSLVAASLCILAAVCFTSCAKEAPKPAATPTPKPRVVYVPSSTHTNTTTSTTVVKPKKRYAPSPWETTVVGAYDDNSR